MVILQMWKLFQKINDVTVAWGMKSTTDTMRTGTVTALTDFVVRFVAAFVTMVYVRVIHAKGLQADRTNRFLVSQHKPCFHFWRDLMPSQVLPRLLVLR
jgi:hypothetical protein